MALSSDPKDQTALYHLIQALRKSGQTKEIPDLLKRLADLRIEGTKAEAEHNRYKLVEEKNSLGASNGLDPEPPRLCATFSWFGGLGDGAQTAGPGRIHSHRQTGGATGAVGAPFLCAFRRCGSSCGAAQLR